MIDREIEAVKKAILVSGTDDWVHIAEVTLAAAQAMYGEHRLDGFPSDETMSVEQLASLRQDWVAAQERTALPLGIRAVKELIRDGLVRIGDATDSGFIPWEGSAEAIESRIDRVVEEAPYPLLPGHLFWFSNTPSGDEMANTFD